MEIVEVSKEEYKQKVNTEVFYNTVPFSELNSNKVERVVYLLGKDEKYRFGITIGINHHEVYCPFSAPFGIPVSIRKRMSIQYYEAFVPLFLEYLKERNFLKITLILSPMFYFETEISIWLNCFFRYGFVIEKIDLNYQIPLIGQDYLKRISRKRNLIIAEQAGLIFEQCKNIEEEKTAYEIISENRIYKDRPLKMTWDDMKKTMECVDHEVFWIRKEAEVIASAFVFHVTKQIAQVIYWGDKPGDFTQFKPMNYLAYQTVGFYKERNFTYLDIGPSTENGVPNDGLCDFKANIGCDVSSKFSLVKNL